jgi:rhodanese-related sulfurtransferase
MTRNNTLIGARAGAVVLMLTLLTQGKADTIHSTGRLFRICWTSSSVNITCVVERADSPAGPWNALKASYVTMPSNQTDTVMSDSAKFFRIVLQRPDPHFSDITVDQSLELLRHRRNDPAFVIIDIRRDYEYNALHIVNALNIDYYASSFQSQLNALDKTKAYLIYCRTGSRTGSTMPIMRNLGFKEVYNMLGGITAFDDVAGADKFLE